MNDVPARLLRDTLRAAMEPAASSGCIDTETLAAWVDGTLNARERKSIESHAARAKRRQHGVGADGEVCAAALDHLLRILVERIRKNSNGRKKERRVRNDRRV